jgi:hypothetical protein
MNRRDRDRLKVLHGVEKGHLTQKQAGMQLNPIPQSGMAAEYRAEKHQVKMSKESRLGDRKMLMEAGVGSGRWSSGSTRASGCGSGTVT